MRLQKCVPEEKTINIRELIKCMVTVVYQDHMEATKLTP